MSDQTTTPDDGGDDLTFELSLLGSFDGQIRQVAFGLSPAPTILLEYQQRDGGVVLALTAGGGAHHADGMGDYAQVIAETLELAAQGVRQAIDTGQLGGDE